MKNNRIKIFLVCSLLFTLLVPPAAAATKTVKVKITLASVELVENNHVGNEWYTTASINGKAVKEGSTVTLNLKPSDSIQLKAYAEEQDKVPDVGTKSVSVKVSSISKSLSKSLAVQVVENRGRYSGNTAEWKFAFKIQK
ncbi:hypothetical protein [Cohnella zeiphila]|uniref:Uncharacterized protein n=1 Tax=Cohnella zeiphila TaxID=2761120 RepID=A0A7X0VWE2_9BACL|nr:hypothetical protein [Cohnella zeiphila]MBB6732322.1 hypothetical protein [Cohnella zeiphila]